MTYDTIEELTLYGTLKSGDFFGTSSVHKQQSLDYFGDIYAESEVICYTLSRPDFERIPFYEQEVMK